MFLHRLHITPKAVPAARSVNLAADWLHIVAFELGYEEQGKLLNKIKRSRFPNRELLRARCELVMIDR